MLTMDTPIGYTPEILAMESGDSPLPPCLAGAL